MRARTPGGAAVAGPGFLSAFAHWHSLLGHPVPARDFRSPHGRPTGPPRRRSDSVGVSVFRTHETRPGWDALLHQVESQAGAAPDVEDHVPRRAAAAAPPRAPPVVQHPRPRLVHPGVGGLWSVDLRAAHSGDRVLSFAIVPLVYGSAMDVIDGVPPADADRVPTRGASVVVLVEPGSGPRPSRPIPQTVPRPTPAATPPATWPPEINKRLLELLADAGPTRPARPCGCPKVCTEPVTCCFVYVRGAAWSIDGASADLPDVLQLVG
jgi:hypothetical protein